ncbi:30S ribosomal protein S10 [Candidatus Lokiarchaeum ossiferum]|uniref:Small ribosomal subunit protein uS10 n=1 Tax=Candidatus Lokiarchaeum ossiferum TaxID=2951803 RepID=A0ABY6HK25_9ARCH|nr:30S ribosomal protein S10 [Candidatus Lokiarchaeum sp. B-35]
MQKARVRLSSVDMDALNQVISEIKRVVTKTGVKMYGPVPLPTKKLTIPTQKSPCGEGTTTWEHYQMRIHKRLIDVNADERSMVLIMKIMFPEQVLVEIELI